MNGQLDIKICAVQGESPGSGEEKTQQQETVSKAISLGELSTVVGSVGEKRGLRTEPWALQYLDASSTEGNSKS